MRQKFPDKKNALSILESSKRTMDYTLSLEPKKEAAGTIVRNIYECFRMLGDALLVRKGLESKDHIVPIREVSSINIPSKRPLSSVENLRNLRHNVNYYGYNPTEAELMDSISLAKECFYLAYEKIKKEMG